MTKSIILSCMSIYDLIDEYSEEKEQENEQNDDLRD